MYHLLSYNGMDQNDDLSKARTSNLFINTESVL